MLSFISKIATHHNTSKPHDKCEDTVWCEELPHAVFGGIFDGCSSGKDTAWASTTLAYCFKVASKQHPCVSDTAIKDAYNTLVALARELHLVPAQLESTAILFYYMKSTSTLYVRPLGDGILIVDGNSHYFDQNNSPDYIANVKPSELDIYLLKYPTQEFKVNSNFQVCSDGLREIKRIPLDDTEPKYLPSILTSSPTSTNYLERMINLLKRDRYVLFDDLSIVSYAKEL